MSQPQEQGKKPRGGGAEGEGRGAAPLPPRRTNQLLLLLEPLRSFLASAFLLSLRVASCGTHMGSPIR